MRKLSIQQKLNIIFVGILIIFGILIYSTYHRAQEVTQNRLNVGKTEKINDLLENILSSSTDIETGARGYTITGEEEYLLVYRTGTANLTIYIESLRILVSKDQKQLSKLEKLKVLVELKKKICTEIIESRRESGMLAAVKIVQSGRGKEAMDAIRIAVIGFQKQAVKSLAFDIKSTEENVLARNLIFTIFAIITFLTLLLGYLVLRRNANLLLKDKIIQQNLMNELTFQNHQLNDFASITSHNLRSPAINISSLIETADENSTIEDYKMLFEMLKKVAKNLNGSLNQLMEVLQIRRNTVTDRESLEFEPIYNKIIDSLQGEIFSSQAVFTHNFTSAPLINYSKIYLESILHNLMSNAIKYRNPERIPIVNVYTETKNNHIYLYVTDNGLGIDLVRYGTKIFGMNQIFHNHPDAKGFGLFMTKTQIESMNGKITVSSEVNVGTTFIVDFGV